MVLVSGADDGAVQPDREWHRREHGPRRAAPRPPGPPAPGAVLATHALFAPSSEADGYKLQLTLDVPSASTGTGSALLLDGEDTALVRCAVVDGAANDALVAEATDRVTFRVLSGPGRVAGTANGDPTSHEWLKSDSTAAYLGLARGMFRVTQDCTSAARADCAGIDLDAARSPTAVFASASGCDLVAMAREPIHLEFHKGHAPPLDWLSRYARRCYTSRLPAPWSRPHKVRAHDLRHIASL